MSLLICENIEVVTIRNKVKYFITQCNNNNCEKMCECDQFWSLLILRQISAKKKYASWKSEYLSPKKCYIDFPGRQVKNICHTQNKK